MKENDLISKSLHENLSGLTVSPEMRDKMFECITEGEKMRRKFPVSTALAAAIMLLCLTAFAVGASVFDYFSGSDTRLENVSEIKGDETQIESGELGNVLAKIDSAYFDGESLLIGFVIENANRVEAYIPTENDLENARRVVDPIAVHPTNEAERAILNAFSQAIEAGTPYGYKMARVYASDHTLVNGEDVPPYSSMEDYDETGAYRAVREFESPLPEEIISSDCANVEIKLYEACTVHYFDGTDIKTYDLVIREAGYVRAEIFKADLEKHSYEGTAQIEDITFNANAYLSPMQGTVTVYADKEIFELVTYTYEGYTWKDTAWQLMIFDENGREYRVMDGYSLSGENPFKVNIKGTGEIPGELHVYLLAAGKEPDTYDFWPIAEKKYENPHIVLKLNKG